MPYIRIVISFFLFLSFVFPSTFAEGKELLRGTVYFGEAWPINFWNSDLSSASDDMERLKKEGFNTVLFVVPWGEFQPGLTPVRFNEQAYARLSQLCDIAKQKDFKVFLRISYRWDMYPDVEQPNIQRQHALFSSDALIPAWSEYLKRIAAVTENKLDGVVLSWEEFWGIIDMMATPREPKESVRLSKEVGFDAWLKARDAEYKKTCAEALDLYGGYPIPKRTSKDFRLVFEWFDERFAQQLLPVVARHFPQKATIEARVDRDPVYDEEKVIEWYSHHATYDKADSPYLFTYWSPAMGAENKGEHRKAKEVIATFAYLQKAISEHTDKKIFINQFLFEDNTPSAARNAQIRTEEMESFFTESGPKLVELTSGYATWGDRDYRACMLFNGSFALGTLGWQTRGTVTVKTSGEHQEALLHEGSLLSQRIPEHRDFYRRYARNNTLQMSVAGTGILEVTFAGKTYRISSTEKKQDLNLVFPKSHGDETVSFKALSGNLTLSNIYLYNFIWRSNIRDYAGKAENNLFSVMDLNAFLKAQQDAPSALLIQDGTLNRFTTGIFAPEQGDAGEPFVWAEPVVEAEILAGGSHVSAEGYIKPSLFPHLGKCTVDFSIDDHVMSSQTFVTDGQMLFDIPIPENKRGSNIKITLASSCIPQKNALQASSDKRALSFILMSIKTY